MASIPTAGALAPVGARGHAVRSTAALATALVVGTLLQTCGAASLPLEWPRPDVVLMVALAWGYLRGGGAGLVAATLGGALLDVASSAPLGLHMFAFALAAAGLARPAGSRPISVPAFVASAVLAAAGAQLVMTVVMQLRGWDVWWSAALFRSMLPALALDGPVALACYVALSPVADLAPEATSRWRAR